MLQEDPAYLPGKTAQKQNDWNGSSWTEVGDHKHCKVLASGCPGTDLQQMHHCWLENLTS